MAMRIEDYALIGDCHTSALVGRNGSIDWLCLPTFDSGACFAALLGKPEHGRWLLAPVGEIRSVNRHYRGDTLVLETEIETDEGKIAVVDCMPIRSKTPKLVRMVIGKRGTVRMRMQLIIRFDYGSVVPWVRQIEGGIQAVGGPDTLRIHTPVKLRGEDLTTVGEFTVSRGEQVPFVMTWHPSHEKDPPVGNAESIIRGTERWWRRWSSRCTHESPWRQAVLRSLITLKALTYAPTGGIVAAPTTSLPEQIGSVRNWDYRLCWLRDATFTLYAMLTNGYTSEATDWQCWLLRAVAGTPSQLNVMYGLQGERRLTEIELAWLPGYENSSPVRIGNAAHEQFQLDVFGEVMAMMHVARRTGSPRDENTWAVQRAILEYLEKAWREPDDGIWEIRGPRRHFTHSKVMAWVAFDRAIKAVDDFGLNGPAEHWRELRQQVHDEVCRQGFDSGLNSFVQYYGSEDVDASLLMIPIVGFLPPQDPRVVGTVDAIQKRLQTDGFVARYPTRTGVDGLPPGEGAFFLCTFWLADVLTMMGRREEARTLFEQLLALRNDVGLLSEQYDPSTKRMLGNFPQAFSHVGLVNTATRLSCDQHAGSHLQGK
jgi:GH15 family glucan-1,4-alpha-glucosidase